ncbi:MAG TPA: PilW family protein [Casimicrobiaceae bacterium]|jgi:type IV pilus assembly protein PilW|nr:PilW family protein [Casimicrobiaceae bacterium]
MKPILRGRRAPAQGGFSLIEIMVGVVIGMIAVLVIFQVYNVAEGFKRNTTAYGEAMQGGLLSTFVLGMELGNAGTGINATQTDLQWCPPPAPITGNVSDIANTFRPIPVLIADSPSGNTNFDSFAVSYSVASTLVTSVPFTANAGLAASYQVQSTGGFHPGDLIVGIQAPGTPTACASSTVTVVTPPDPLGVVTITQSGTALTFTASSVLFNMGPCDRAQKVQYSVANNVLLSTPLLNSNKLPAAACGQPVAAPVPSPVASNVVVMKAEYGINTSKSKERELDTWVQATVGGGWDPTTLLQAPITTINQIKAVRIGVIVQSEQFDKTLGDYNWVLFDCSDANKANCPGRLTGTMAASVTPQGNWRFRKYETIIPLRNSIWNPT